MPCTAAWPPPAASWPARRSWPSRPIITESDRSISEEKIRELEALERAEAQRLAELEAQDVEVEIRRAEYELKAAEARRDQARAGPGGMPPEGPAARHRPPHPRRPGRRAGGPTGPAGRAVRRRRPAGDPRHGRAGVRRAASRKASPPWSATRPIPPPPGAAGSSAWPAGTVSAATVLHDPSQLSDVRTLECVIVLEPGQPRLRLGQSVRIFIGPVSP